MASKRKDFEREDVEDEGPPGGRDDCQPWTVVSQWPTQVKAARMVGVSARRFAQLCKDREVTWVIGEDKSRRFNPDELERLRDELGIVEEEIERNTEERRATIELIRAQSDAIVQRDKQIERLLSLISDPLKYVIDASRDMATLDRNRVLDLERMRDQMFVERKEALSAKAERELIAVKARGDEARKSEAWTLALQNMPRLMKGLEATLMGKGGGGLERFKAADRLISSLEPEMVASLLELDMLTQEQQADLMAVLPQEQKDKIAQARAKKDDAK